MGRRLTVLRVLTGEEELAEGAADALGAGVREADLGRSVKHIWDVDEVFGAPVERVSEADPLQCTLALVKWVRCGGRGCRRTRCWEVDVGEASPLRMKRIR